MSPDKNLDNSIIVKNVVNFFFLFFFSFFVFLLLLLLLLMIALAGYVRKKPYKEREENLAGVMRKSRRTQIYQYNH